MVFLRGVGSRLCVVASVDHDTNISTFRLAEWVEDKFGIPLDQQNLSIGPHPVTPSQSHYIDLTSDALVWINLRLCGGKGGFGRNLRSGTVKVGAKRTTDFGASRDLSGRRIRHVQAEQQLREWISAEHKIDPQEVQEQFSRIKRDQRLTQKQCKFGLDCKYRFTTCKNSHPIDESEELDARERARLRSLGSSFSADSSDLHYEDVGSSRPDDVEAAVEEGLSRQAQQQQREQRQGRGLEHDQSTGKRAAWRRVDGPAGGPGSLMRSKTAAEVAALLELGLLDDTDDEDDEEDEDQNEGEDEDEDEDGDEDEDDDHGDEEDEKEAEDAGDGQSATRDEKRQDAIRTSGGPGKTVEHTIDTMESTSSSSSSSSSYSLSSSPSSSSSSSPSSSSPSPLASSASNTSSSDAARGQQRQTVDLASYSSASALEGLGREVLKAELARAGLKSGGTLQELASRLFLLRDAQKEDISRKHWACSRTSAS